MEPLRVAGEPAEVVATLRGWLDAADPPPLVVETSGSTGAPKRVLLSRRAVLASVAATARRLGSEGRWALRLPASYVAGVQVIVRSLVAGHEPVLDGWADDRGSATHTSLVPTQLHRLLDSAAGRRGAGGDGRGAARRRTRSTRGCGSGRRRPGSGWWRPTAWPRPAGAASTTATPSTGSRSRSATDGRIRIGGPTLFDGYDGDPAATAEALVDGWFLTSDAGRLDEDGRLHVLGRLDDVVVSGGVNVPTPAVAARLREHPDVADAAVVGVPDEEWGNRVVAFVVGSLDARRRARLGGRRPTRARGRRARSSWSTRSRCWPTARSTGWPCRPERGSGDEGLVDPDAHPVPRHHRPRGGADRGRGRVGRVEPVPGVRRPRSPSRGCAAPRRRRPATGRSRCATRVPVNVTVPAVDPETAHRITRDGGCRTAKVKVAEPGQTLADDEARLEAVRDALGPDGRIRVDANGGWDVDAAVAAIAALDRAAGGLEYVEQPCATVEDLAAVRRRVDVPIAADESIRRAADPYRVRDLEAADVAVLKVQPLGGVRACLRIAEDIGLPVVVSSALETSVGIAAGRRARRRAARAALRLRPGDRAAAHRRRRRRAAAAGRRRAAGDPAGRRPGGARPARRRARPGGPLGAPAGRRTAGSASVTSTLLARGVVGALIEAGRHRRRARAGIAQRAPRLRGVRRGRGRPAAAPHPHRRADRRLPRAGAEPHAAHPPP